MEIHDTNTICDETSLFQMSGPLSSTSDDVLVGYAKAGFHPAYTELVRRHSNMALRIAYRITRNTQDSEDVLQESLLRVFGHINSFDGRSAFTTWFTRIAINSSLMVLRKRRNHVLVSLDDDETDHPQLPDSSPNAEDLLIYREEEASVRCAIKKLPPALRVAIVARYLGERSTNDTALLVESSLAATKSRLLRGRKLLRVSLGETPGRLKRMPGPTFSST